MKKRPAPSEELIARLPAAQQRQLIQSMLPHELVVLETLALQRAAAAAQEAARYQRLADSARKVHKAKARES